MILSNVLMQEALESGCLIIDPRPSPQRPGQGQKCPYDTHSVNLKLSNELSVPSEGPYSFDLEQGGDLSTFLSRNSEKLVIPMTGYTLERFQFVIGKTWEYVSLPIDHPINSERGKCLAARGSKDEAAWHVAASSSTSPPRLSTRISMEH